MFLLIITVSMFVTLYCKVNPWKCATPFAGQLQTGCKTQKLTLVRTVEGSHKKLSVCAQCNMQEVKLYRRNKTFAYNLYVDKA